MKSGSGLRESPNFNISRGEKIWSLGGGQEGEEEGKYESPVGGSLNPGRLVNQRRRKTYEHYYKMWVQFISPHSLDH
jgi:hypothetical protein